MEENFIKVYFDLGTETESLWAEPRFRPDSRPTFLLQNSPFYVKGISFLDIVSAVPRQDGGGYDFREIVGRGGHSTFWLFQSKGNRGFEAYWPRLEALGCSYEGSAQGPQQLYAVDVPETVNIQDVRAILQEGRNNGVWTIEEAHIGHPLV